MSFTDSMAVVDLGFCVSVCVCKVRMVCVKFGLEKGLTLVPYKEELALNY